MSQPGSIPHCLRVAALALAVTAAVGVQAHAWATPHASAGQPATSAADDGALRQYLQAKRAAIDAAAARPASPRQIHATVTAESRSGVRRLRLGEQGRFQYISDSGRDYAGYDLGAGSWPSLIGTLASAVADEYVVQAAASGIALDGLELVFTSTPQRKSANLSYPNNLAYVAYVQSPASDAQLQELRSKVEQASSALDLVSRAQPVADVDVQYTRSPAQRAAGQPPGLRDFITDEKRPAVLSRQRAAATPGTRGEAQGLFALAHVEPHTGLRQVSLGRDGYHLQLHDSAPELLGRGIAPTVEEHLLGVSATCLTHIFEVQAASRNVLLDSLQLTVDGTLTPRFGSNVSGPARFQNLRYVARVESPADAAQIEALRDAVEASCPLYNLIKDAQPVQGSIVRGVYSHAG